MEGFRIAGSGAYGAPAQEVAQTTSDKLRPLRGHASFRVEGLGFRVEGLGFEGLGLEFIGASTQTTIEASANLTLKSEDQVPR